MKHIRGIVQQSLAQELYQEEKGSTFQDGRDFYDLNVLFQAVEGSPVKSIEVSKIDWVYSEDEEVDEQRVEAADVKVPILVSFVDGRELVIDGFHRLVKAKRKGLRYLPYQRVSASVLASALLPKRTK